MNHFDCPSHFALFANSMEITELNIIDFSGGSFRIKKRKIKSESDVIIF